MDFVHYGTIVHKNHVFPCLGYNYVNNCCCNATSMLSCSSANDEHIYTWDCMACFKGFTTSAAVCVHVFLTSGELSKEMHSLVWDKLLTIVI